MANFDKNQDAHVEYGDEKVGSDSNGSQEGFHTEFTPAEQKKIMHRIDRRLVVMVGLMYCVSLMDRTNLSAAAIAG